MWNDNARTTLVEKAVWGWEVKVSICCIDQVEWRPSENKTTSTWNRQKGQNHLKINKVETRNIRVKHKPSCSSNEKTQWDVKEQRHQWSWKW